MSSPTEGPRWGTRPLDAPEWTIESVERFESNRGERSVPRTTTPLTMTDAVSRADCFQRNLMFIRAEERLAAQPRWKRLWRKMRRMVAA